MTATNNKYTLEKINDSISNSTLAAVASIALVLGLISISEIEKDPDKIRNMIELVQGKVPIGSVMYVNLSSPLLSEK